MDQKHVVVPAAYVFLEREDGACLFLRRQGTDYMPGKYQMPSGHVEANEMPSEAAVRETKEEVGVDIDPSDLELIHTSYRITGGERDRVDFFYRTKKWSGEVQNMEPHKCDDLHWTSMTNLHEDTVPVVRVVIEYILEGKTHSEILTPKSS